MAEADDKVVKKAAASLLPVMAVEKKKQEKKAAPFPAVKLVSLWALLAAAILVSAFAFAMLTPSWHPSWLRKPAELTGAAAAEERAIGHAVPWCTAAQAAAAAAALLLPDRRRRSRRALAYAALAATATAHLMCARVVTLHLAADPGDIFSWTVGTADVVMYAAADITCFLALLGKLKDFSWVLGRSICQLGD